MVVLFGAIVTAIIGIAVFTPTLDAVDNSVNKALEKQPQLQDNYNDARASQDAASEAEDIWDFGRLMNKALIWIGIPGAAIGGVVTAVKQLL